MIIDEVYFHKFADLLHTAFLQPEKIKRIILEVDPEFKTSELDWLIHKNDWPVACHPNIIIKSEEQKQKRATYIANKYIQHPFSRILDFGCGEGHLTRLLAQKATYALGYDINPPQGEHFTDSFNQVRNNAPYDTIIVFDVFDHMQHDDPGEMLRHLGELLTDDGKILIRFHPWCSKHATHIYHTFNKAYAHLFYTDEELKEHKPIFTRKILNPIAQYGVWVAQANLVTLSLFIVRDEVNSFFINHPLLSSIIKNHWAASIDEKLATGQEFPLYQLEQQFVDYVLVKESYSK